MGLVLTRRQFLISLAAGTDLAPSLEHQMIAGQVPTFSVKERRTLLVVMRTLFPQGNFEERDYTKAIDALNARCTSDQKISTLLARGLAELEKGRFTEVVQSVQISMLKKMETTDFFRLVYNETVESLYGSHDLWHKLAPAVDVSKPCSIARYFPDDQKLKPGFFPTIAGLRACRPRICRPISSEDFFPPSESAASDARKSESQSKTQSNREDNLR